jgi:hypothetical protein
VNSVTGFRQPFGLRSRFDGVDFGRLDLDGVGKVEVIDLVAGGRLRRQQRRGAAKRAEIRSDFRIYSSITAEFRGESEMASIKPEGILAHRLP